MTSPRARAIRLADACLESSDVVVPFTLEWSPRTPQAASTFAVRGLEKRGPAAAELETCLKQRAQHALWDAAAFQMQIAPPKR